MKDNIFLLIIGYFVVMNIIGLFTMGIDKRRAISREWRIKESTLLWIALLGGAIGSLIGMKLYRHKTKHRKFVIVIPLSALLYVYLGYYIYQYFN